MLKQKDNPLRPEVIADLWRESGLKNKLLFTLVMILVVRTGVHIPISGVNLDIIKDLFNQGNLLGFIDLFAGGAMAKFSLFAMGIIPYINASIIIQLMTAVIPKLEELQKEGGESGRRQIAQITRYLTVILASVQAFGMSIWIWRSGAVLNAPATGPAPVFFILDTAAVLIAGTVFMMWVGELITEHGIGNGASLLIFIGIIARLPDYMTNTYQLVSTGGTNWFMVGILMLIFLGIMVLIVYASEGSRRLPVQSAKRQVGNRMYGGRATYLPFRINQGGVMPIIFASSVMLFPATIYQFAPVDFLKTVTQALAPSQPLYAVAYIGLILFFTFFYASIILNPKDISDNLKRYGSFIPGYRPGRPTAEYIEYVLTRITFCGAVFLGFIALLPMVAEKGTGVVTFQGLGSTALLIMVGVAIDIFNQLQTHLLARQYEGFMKQ